MKLIEYADRDMLFINLAQQIAGEMENMLFHDEALSLAVPGGTTRKLLKALWPHFRN